MELPYEMMYDICLKADDSTLLKMRETSRDMYELCLDIAEDRKNKFINNLVNELVGTWAFTNQSIITVTSRLNHLDVVQQIALNGEPLIFSNMPSFFINSYKQGSTLVNFGEISLDDYQNMELLLDFLQGNNYVKVI